MCECLCVYMHKCVCICVCACLCLYNRTCVHMYTWYRSNKLQMNCSFRQVDSLEFEVSLEKISPNPMCTFLNYINSGHKIYINDYIILLILDCFGESEIVQINSELLIINFNCLHRRCR